MDDQAACMVQAKRRGRGEDAIYWDESKGRWYGSVSLGLDSGGKQLRRNVTGKTKTEVKDKLKELHADLEAGVQTSASYTVAQAAGDWMKVARDGRAASTLRRDERILQPLLARHAACVGEPEISGRSSTIKLSWASSTRR